MSHGAKDRTFRRQSRVGMAEMFVGGVIVSEPSSQQSKTPSEDGAAADDAINQIRDALRGLRFGSVNIIVQDGVIIQIDRTEKRRIRGSRTNPPIA
jgi:hypothetical protein